MPVAFNNEKTLRLSVISDDSNNLIFDNRPYINILIFNDKINCLLDSGANICVLGKGSESFLEKWPFERSKINASINTADNTSIIVTHYILLPVTYREDTKFVKFLISPNINKTCILGMNFWHIFGLAIAGLDLISLEMAKECTIKSDLTSEEKEILAKTIAEFDFAQGNKSIGKTNLFKHTIDVQGKTELKQQMYPISPAMQTEVNKEVDRLLSLGIIERTYDNTWLSPVIPVKKSSGGIRLVLDARELNKHTKKFTNGPQNANRIISRLRGSKYISSIDVSDGYYNIEIDEDSRNYTAFAISGKGTFRYTRMANGLCNAAHSFCNAMEYIIGYEKEPYILIYMDDLIIMTDTFNEHIDCIKFIMSRLNEYGFKGNLEKSQFCRESIDFLGLRVSKTGIEPNPDKIKAIQEYPPPNTLTKARRFIGMLIWHSRFIRDFSVKIAPIT